MQNGRTRFVLIFFIKPRVLNSIRLNYQLAKADSFLTIVIEVKLISLKNEEFCINDKKHRFFYRSGFTQVTFVTQLFD